MGQDVQTNFRAEDMIVLGSTKDEPSQAEQPREQKQEQEQEQQSAPQPPEQGSGDDAPKGTSQEILAWVGDDKERARRALDAEGRNEKPRSRLTKGLKKVLGQ